MTKTGLIIRHVPHEGIAGFREPIEAAGYRLDRIDVGDPGFGALDLGAQMIAAALGAPVYPGPAKEVGFDALTILDPASPLGHLTEVPVLHWHGDTFDLPADAELLASSAAYPHQAFRRGPNILALQFHAEMGLDPRFEHWVDQWPEALAEVGSTPDAMRADHARLGPGAVDAGRRMIGQWLEELAG